MILFDKLSDSECKEIDGFLRRKAVIKNLAQQIIDGQEVSKEDKVALGNYVDNLSNILQISNAPKNVKEDAKTLFEVLNNYEPKNELVVEGTKEKSEVTPINLSKSVSNISTTPENELIYYFKMSAGKLIVSFALAGCLIFGVPNKVADAMIGLVSATTESFSKIQTEVEAEELQNSNVEYNAEGNVNSFLDNYNTTAEENLSVNSAALMMVKAVKSITSLLFTVIVATTMMGLALDMLYIAILPVREMMEINGMASNIISPAARTATMQINVGNAMSEGEYYVMLGQQSQNLKDRR